VQRTPAGATADFRPAAGSIEDGPLAEDGLARQAGTVSGEGRCRGRLTRVVEGERRVPATAGGWGSRRPAVPRRSRLRTAPPSEEADAGQTGGRHLGSAEGDRLGPDGTLSSPAPAVRATETGFASRSGLDRAVECALECAFECAGRRSRPTPARDLLPRRGVPDLCDGADAAAVGRIASWPPRRPRGGGVPMWNSPGRPGRIQQSRLGRSPHRAGLAVPHGSAGLPPLS